VRTVVRDRIAHTPHRGSVYKQPSPPRQLFDRSGRRVGISSDASGDGPDDASETADTDETERADDDSGGLVTRRRLLYGAGGAVALLGGGGLYAANALDGDAGGYEAPETQPMVSTRGRLDDEDPTTRSGSWAFDDADAVVLFVHGLGADAESARDLAYTTRLGLETAFGAAGGADAVTERVPPVIGYSWASNVDWGPAKETADANAAPLADWLTAWADSDGRPVHLFAHSLGARVTGAALSELADRGRTDPLASASLLGGAIPRDTVGIDGRYGPAIAALDAPLYNFHSRNDRVLGWVYRASDRTRAVGHGGLSDAATAPDGYADVDVTDLVADHYSYVEPAEGCLPRAVERVGLE
jgi:predicted esterase